MTNHYVRITRDDGSVTYKGPWGPAHCQTEADAWIETFPTYTVELVAAATEREAVARWDKITGGAERGVRYYPETVTS